MENGWRWVPPPIRHLVGYLLRPTVIVLLFCGILFAFFTQSSLVNIYKTNQQYNALREKERYYRARIEEDSIRLDELKSSNAALEKYAREQFYMHRDNETVYVIEERIDPLN